MRVFYSDNAVTLYHGDARGVGGVLADAIITDPPYRSLDAEVGRGTTTRLVGGGGARKAQEQAGSDGQDWFATLTDHEISELLLRFSSAFLVDSGAMYVFSDVKTGLRVFPTLDPANVLVWDKGRIGMGYNWRRMHEWIAYCPRRDHRLRFAGRGDILRVAPVDQKEHPTEKPSGLLEILIQNSTDVGQVVFDPFAGSGSTLVAAKMLGRRAIGVEANASYCEVAARRLRQEVLL